MASEIGDPGAFAVVVVVAAALFPPAVALFTPAFLAPIVTTELPAAGNAESTAGLYFAKLRIAGAEPFSAGVRGTSFSAGIGGGFGTAGFAATGPATAAHVTKDMVSTSEMVLARALAL